MTDHQLRYKRRRIKRNLNLVGMRFGNCTVLEEVPKDNQRRGQGRAWVCRCDCGEIVIKRQILLFGKHVQCHECWGRAIREAKRHDPIKIRNEMIGAHIDGGEVVEVIEREFKTSNRKYCVVRCECGVLTKKPLSAVRGGFVSGRCRPCANALVKETQSPAWDLTGQRFGDLVVLRKSPTHQRKFGRTMTWECRCDCGNLHDASRTNLRSGHTTRCGGCSQKSRSATSSDRMHRLNAEKDLTAQFITLQEKLYAKLGPTD